MTAPPPHACPPTRSIPLALIAMITFGGTLGMHIFVPALPIAGADLGVSPSLIQLTVSVYIAGLAVGQLFYGPVSDRLGRRPTLLAGLTLYLVATLAALAAMDVWTLLAARLFQALGGCAGLVLGRAIVRDTAAGHLAARRLAMLNLMVTLGPGLAPLLGGALATSVGWRSLFVAMALLGAVNIALVWRLLPETRGAPAPARSGAYRRLLVNRTFLAYTVGGGCATTAGYGFIAAAPFIFVNDLGRSLPEIGPYMGVLVLGFSLGSLLATRVLGRAPLRVILIASNGVSLAAGAIFLALAATGSLTLLSTLGLMAFYTLGAGVASPAALTEAISADPKAIGSASGLYGFGQMAIGAICTALAGLGAHPSLSAGLVIAGAAALAQLCFWGASIPPRQ